MVALFSNGFSYNSWLMFTRFPCVFFCITFGRFLFYFLIIFALFLFFTLFFDGCLRHVVRPCVLFSCAFLLYFWKELRYFFIFLCIISDCFLIFSGWLVYDLWRSGVHAHGSSHRQIAHVTRLLRRAWKKSKSFSCVPVGTSDRPAIANRCKWQNSFVSASVAYGRCHPRTADPTRANLLCEWISTLTRLIDFRVGCEIDEFF